MELINIMMNYLTNTMDIGNKDKLRTIILAGGKGDKIFPYNSKWQKSCLPIGNVPNIIRIIDQLEKAGIEDTVVLVDYLDTQVTYNLRDYKKVEIVKTSPNTIRNDIYNGIGDKDAIIYYGDAYVSDEDINNLLLTFINQGSCILLEKKNNNFRYSDYICANEKDGIIRSIYGHPREHYVNSRIGGVFAIENSLSEYIRYCPETFLNVPVGGMPPTEFFLEQCIMNAIEDHKEISAVYVNRPIVDMDFPWDILFANEKYCIEEVGKLEENKIGINVHISDKAKINGKLYIGDNSIIGDNVLIKGNCFIGDNTIIENGVIIEENCVIGHDSIINDYCKILSNTVIGNHNKIGFTAEISGVTFDRVSMVHHSQIFGVVGRGTDIAAGCQVAIMRFDDLENPNRVGNKVYNNRFSNAAFLGDNTRTGIGNIFYPGVKIGSNCALAPGAVIQKDVQNNKIVFVNQDLIIKDWDSDRYGW